MANGTSFRAKLVVVFQVPSLALKDFWTETFITEADLPLIVTSFSQSAAETVPAVNFFTGLLLFMVVPSGLLSNATSPLFKIEKRTCGEHIRIYGSFFSIPLHQPTNSPAQSQVTALTYPYPVSYPETLYFPCWIR